MTARLPKEVNLCGILYRTSEAEGLIVFTEAVCVWGSFTRICFTRGADGMCWYVELHARGGNAMVSHIVKAYELVTAAYGKNFEKIEPRAKA